MQNIRKYKIHWFWSDYQWRSQNDRISYVQYDEAALNRAEVIYCLKWNSLITEDEWNNQDGINEFVHYNYSINSKFWWDSIYIHPLEIYKLMISDSK